MTKHKANMLDPSCVLLTGVTGYIGAFLLECLLQETKADIFCLLRASDLEEGMERIKNTLKTYQVWNDAFHKRIHPVPGDLAQPLLGLSQVRFAELASTIDSIYHSGALVNFAYPYAALKGPNVLGTQEVIRLACQGKPKAIHYVSTIDTLIATHVARPYIEIDVPRQPNVTPDGYMLSKWVAENLLVAARSRGVPACIYRLPWVLGHTKTGVCPTNNMLLVELKGFLQLGIFPESLHDEGYNGIPVDYAARAIIHLSRQEESLGKNFHVWNLEWIPFNQVYDWVRSFGYTFDVVPVDVALERISDVDSSHPLYPLVPTLMEELVGARATSDTRTPITFDPRIECTNALRGLEESGLRCPPSDSGLAHLCFNYLVEKGFLNPPGTKQGNVYSNT